MKNKELLVSIMMCCYNGEKYLVEALNSVLKQSYSNWELIFWDNHSKDDSAKIFKSYSDSRFKYYYSENHTNLGGSRQSAWKKLNGDLVAILDVDDIWLPNKLEIQVKDFVNKEIGISITNSIFFNQHQSKLGFNKILNSGYVYEDLLENYYVSLDTLILRKSFVDKLEYSFRDKFNYICDMDLILRLSINCKLIYHKEPLSKWRYHHNSLTFKDENQFIIEKKLLLNDLHSSSGYRNNLYSKSINIFEKKLYFSELIYIICNKSTIEVLDYFKNLNKKNLINFILIMFFILVPFSKNIIKFVKKKYGMGI